MYSVKLIYIYFLGAFPSLYSQFGFSQHWRWFFVGQSISVVFISRTGCSTVLLLLILILRQFEVHTQTDSGDGARVFMVCQVTCL